MVDDVDKDMDKVHLLVTKSKLVKRGDTSERIVKIYPFKSLGTLLKFAKDFY